MRTDGFLRTPIRGDQQSRMLNLTITETILLGNPVIAAPYPQSLEIAFTTAAGVAEVQIAPLWEGMFRFVADDVSKNPTDPALVTQANYPNWSVTGDLILRTWYGLEGPFKKHIPFVTPAPATVQYSKVLLTQDFLFTTLRQLTHLNFIYNGSRVDQSDSAWFEKFVVQFLKGKAYLPCQHHASDSTQDFALQAMPSVKLDAPGTPNKLLITVASLNNEMLDPNWFTENPAYDGIAGPPLVDPALADLENQLNNPSHPSHSVIPVWVIFQEAAAAAYAADHGSASPLRVALSGLRSDGKVYRRIELLRPRFPGAPISLNPQRPYPTYQLCWRPVGGGAAECLKIPLSGRLYLPLSAGDFTFWAISRTGDPAVLLSSDQLKLSVQSAAVKYIGVPQSSLVITVGGNRSQVIYAHLLEFDSNFIFEGFKQLGGAKRTRLKNKAKADWNIDILDWTIPQARIGFAPIYGFIRESAGRHGLAPEFLHAVFFGEGGNWAIEGQPAYDPLEIINAFGFAGLDLIIYRLGKVPVGKRSHPPEIPAAEVEEIAEYHYNLEANGYVDPVFTANVAYSGEKVRTEAVTRTLQIGQITGWQTAIELVAAELHQRLDEMFSYCASHVPPIPLDDEIRRRYLTYIRYLSKPSTAQNHADNVQKELLKWVGLPPPEPPPYTADLRRFKSLQRISVAQWYESASVYR